MPILKQIADFMQAHIVTNVLCLPQNYPANDGFYAFQDGYRYNANTGQTLTGEGDGDFKPSWYVLCTNYFFDPFFVDFTEEALGFPVYYAAHGAGRWDAIPVSKTVTQFTIMLQGLTMVEDDAPRAIALINSFPFSGQTLWQEAIVELKEQNES